MNLNQYATPIFLFLSAITVFLFALSRSGRAPWLTWGLKFYEYPVFWIASLIGFAIHWRPAPWLYRLGNKLPGCLFVPAGETHQMKGQERLVFGQIDGTINTAGHRLLFAGTVYVTGALVAGRPPSSETIFGDGSEGVIEGGDVESLTKDKNYPNIEADSIVDLMARAGYTTVLGGSFGGSTEGSGSGGGGSTGGGYVPVAFTVSGAGGVGGTSPPVRYVCPKCDRTMSQVPARFRKGADPDALFKNLYCAFCDPSHLTRLEAELPRPKICIERDGEKFWLVLLSCAGGGIDEPPAQGDYLDDYVWCEPTKEELWFIAHRDEQRPLTKLDMGMMKSKLEAVRGGSETFSYLDVEELIEEIERLRGGSDK